MLTAGLSNTADFAHQIHVAFSSLVSCLPPPPTHPTRPRPLALIYHPLPPPYNDRDSTLAGPYLQPSVLDAAALAHARLPVLPSSSMSG